MPEQIDDSFDWLLANLNLESWVKFSPEDNQLSVWTDDNNLVGQHRIVLFQYFVNFPNYTYPFTAFNISVLPAPEIN
jgi:hypothetical protein